MRYSEKYRSLSLFAAVPVNVFSLLLLIAGWLGFIRSEKDGLWWMSCALLVCLLFVHFVFFGSSRFRFPLMPFAVIFASLSASRDALLLKGKVSQTKIAAFGGAAIILAIWIVEVFLVANS
jgi:hypothetical protein